MKAVVISLVACTMITIAGCLTVPLGTNYSVDQAAEKRLSEAVPLYDSSKLNADNYIRVGSLTASACDNGFLGGPGRDAILAELRQQAESMGANGLTDLECGHGGTSELHGCFSSTICSATALRIVTSGSQN